MLAVEKVRILFFIFQEFIWYHEHIKIRISLCQITSIGIMVSVLKFWRIPSHMNANINAFNCMLVETLSRWHYTNKIEFWCEEKLENQNKRLFLKNHHTYELCMNNVLNSECMCACACTILCQICSSSCNIHQYVTCVHSSSSSSSSHGTFRYTSIEFAWGLHSHTYAHTHT